MDFAHLVYRLLEEGVTVVMLQDGVKREDGKLYVTMKDAMASSNTSFALE